MMQLYDNPASPFCRKVQIILRETGQLDDVEMTFAIGHPLAPDNMPLAQNPLGKIPCLMREDGTAIYDSRVICRFLDDRANAGYYPDSNIWDVLTLEATADGMMDAAVLMVYEGRSRPAELRYQDWVNAQWDKIARALDAVGTRWIGDLSGPLTIGQIAVGCALGYLDFRHADRNWRDGRGELSDWFAEFSKRDSMVATVPAA